MSFVASATTLAGAVGGCSSRPEPVQVIAWPIDIDQFAGEWHGEFSNPATGQSGTISLELQSGQYTAYGEVMMTWGSFDRSGRAEADPAPSEHGGQSRSVLQIRLVRLEEGAIQATLEPYWDPGCRCRVQTTFSGKLRGDAIEGTFSSSAGGGESWSGTWKSVRKPR